MDMARKLQEDPLYVIRKKEIESRNQILKNPVKLKHLQELVSMSLGVITAFMLGMWCFLVGISLCLLLCCSLSLPAMHHIYTCLLISLTFSVFDCLECHNIF